MRDIEKEIREAFLKKAILPYDYFTAALMERLADGIVAAIKKYDEIMLKIHRTGKPPR